MSAITLDCFFKETPPFTDTSVKKCLWQLFYDPRQLHFIVFAQT